MNYENVTKTTEHIVKMSLTEKELEALEQYLAENALKKGPWIRLLVIRELQEKNILKDPDYQPPKLQSAFVMGARK
ncbi:MAG: hypothetical protein KBT02_11875 [Treponema sp.]|nr:hypothetical protein [Candidatus Treponema caballi]